MQNDIYDSKGRYEYIKKNLDLFGLKPEERKDNS